MWPSAAEAILVLLLAAGSAPGAVTQPVDSQQTAPPDAATSATPDRRDQNEQTGQTATVDAFDIWARIRHKKRGGEDGAWDYRRPMITAAPVIGSKPSTGVIFGAAGTVAFYRGVPKTTHISSVVAAATFSTKKQTSITGRFTVFSRDDCWRLEGDNRLQWSSQDTYGLGTGTKQGDKINVEYDFFRFYETAYRRVRPGLFAGVGLHFSDHRNVLPGSGTTDEAFAQSPYAVYSQENGFDLAAQISAGPSVNLLWDTRDSAINPDHGWLANGSVRTFFKGFLGGSSAWQEVSLDLRTYVKVKPDGRHKLALWLLGDFVAGGVAPYLDLPATGMDAYGRSGRGYPEGRFRGERLVYGEAEYRATLTRNGLLGMVAFLNVTTVTNLQTGERLFDTFAPGAGAGLRLLLNKHSKTNICLDVGFGREGSRGVYLAIQEAF